MTSPSMNLYSLRI